MSGFPILDLVVGMIFIFFLLSIICSSGVELWLSIRKTRAKMLELWLKTIFNSQALDSHGVPIIGSDNKPVNVGQAIMDHCMVTALTKTGTSTTYIDAENFVSALLDKITIQPKGTTTSPGVPNAITTTSDNVQIPPTNLDGYITAIQESKVISGELKRTILILATEAKQAASVLNLNKILPVDKIPSAVNITNNITNAIKSDLEHFKDRLERWYDTNNERLTGKFKRTKVLPRTIVAAIAITVGLNVDTVEISRYFYNNQAESRKFADYAISAYPAYKDRVERMKDLVGKNPDNTVTVPTLDSNVNQLKSDIDSLKAALPPNVPMGWKDRKEPWTSHIPGWLATILAITMGAPFWFDILNKIANLRSNGAKPATNEEKKENK